MNTVNEERMKHIRESSEKIDRARSEIQYASYDVISHSFSFVRDDFASFDESEKKECMKEIFNMVRHALDDHTLRYDGGLCCQGIETLGYVISKLPEEKDELIDETLPLLKFYKNLPALDDPYGLYNSQDVLAVGVLKCATDIALTDKKYAKEMLDIFKQERLQELTKIQFNGHVCGYLGSILKENPSLVDDIAEISKKYNGPSESGNAHINALQKQITEIKTSNAYLLNKVKGMTGK